MLIFDNDRRIDRPGAGPVNQPASLDTRIIAALPRLPVILSPTHDDPAIPPVFGWLTAPPHSITSSARTSMLGGMVRPKALAAFRLMISEYFVG